MTRAPIGDLIQHEIGGGWGEAEPTEQEREPAAVIRGTDLPRVAVGETENVPRRFHRSSALSKRLLRENDIVFEVSGGSKDQPVGRSMLVSQRVLDALDNRAICASFCKLIRIDPDLADPRFVFRVLQLAYVDGSLDRFYVQSTGITNFKWKPFLADYLVDLPSVETQSRVAGVLGAFDDLIENNRRRIALLEQMAQAIYREWFVHFRYPGHEDDELVDSPFGPIPTGWSLMPLGELGPVITESVDPSEVDTGTPAVGLEDIPRRSFTLSEWGRASDLTSRKNRFAAGDVLFGKIRPYFHKVCVAPMDGIASTDAIVVRPVREARGLVTMTMFSDDFVAHAVATSNGTKMPRADWKVLREWLVPIPPDATLSAFEEAVASAVDSCNVLASQSRTLAELRDLLLPKLVTGDIDVSHIDLDALQEEHPA